MYKLLAVLFLAVAALSDSPFCYDHQGDTYTPQFEVTECNKECTVTPFFSPDHSIDTYVELIQSAKESIDLYTPGKLISTALAFSTTPWRRYIHRFQQLE